MAVPFVKTSFVAGEISPSLFGHVDLARYALAASTMRNSYVSYRGGSYSRAGTKFVGFSKQTGQNFPPRLLGFQFSINQGIALEFGDEYMRPIVNGAYVTEAPISITGATQTSPVVITASSSTAVAALALNGGVTVSYSNGDTVTLAGGVTSHPAVFGISGTAIASTALNAPGTLWVPGDTLTVNGGVQTTPALLTVVQTQVVSATVHAGGTGGTPGTQTVTGTTGTGVKFQASVTVSGGGAISAVLSITTPGGYSVNPTSLVAEPVTGAGLTGAQLSVVMGILIFNVTNAGVFTTNPAGGNLTENTTSGAGIGATFHTTLMGAANVTIIDPGVYGTHPTNPVSQASTSGIGVGIEFTVAWSTGAPFVNGDWVFIDDVTGMTQLNGRIFVVQGVSGGTFDLTDVFGNFINGTTYTAYAGGGTVARLYTLTTPYGEADLAYLKWTQSADVMSICCWNQITGTSYPPQDLKRFADNNWTIAAPSFASTVQPPASGSGSASTSGSTDYNYVVTSVDSQTGEESIASPIINIGSAVNIAATAGSITINWAQVVGVQEYNIYKAPPNPSSTVPAGALFGYAGKAYGNQFVDTNITADFQQVPPLHLNPFAIGAITGAPVTLGGSGFTSDPTLTITTSTGSGAVLIPVIVSGVLVAIIVLEAGELYQPGDQITVSGGGGSGATAVLTIGPQTGTYPSVVTYFQERRVYAGTPNNPDTYFMSQPGAFLNFDARIPSTASDSIIGSPWSLQVNGIQFMVPMPGGLVVLTGRQAWQLTGAGGSSLNPQPITPSNQQAQPQAYNGIHTHVPPIQSDYDILYVQAKGSRVRDISYNFFVNIYTGQDITEISSHLFDGYAIQEWASCEEPNKIVWATRNDGVMLSLTFMKPQDIQGWARHDTQGLFISVCSVTELLPGTYSAPPAIDALYVATQRFTPDAATAGVNAYMVERMDNRLWMQAEDCWCVDAALQNLQPAPTATLTASSATGLGSISGTTGLVGGSGYNPATTTASVVDSNGLGPGTGAVPVLTITSGVVTAISFVASPGFGYVNPKLIISDPSGGAGAGATLVLSNAAIFTASASVFGVGSVGSVIRAGGGIAVVTSDIDGFNVNANILSPIVAVVPGTSTVIPQQSGAWTLTAPVSTISALDHLNGMKVTGLADGNVIAPTTVVAGAITLSTPASAITVGLGFQAQTQTVYFNEGSPTVQGQRKRVAAVTGRFEASRGIKAGTNQVDGSTLSPLQVVVPWTNMSAVPDTPPSNQPAVSAYNALCPSLYTGDRRLPLIGGFQKPGQVCFQQDNPLPMNILAVIPDIDQGDLPEEAGPARAPPQRGRGA